MLSSAVVLIVTSDNKTSGLSGSEFGSCSVMLSTSTNRVPLPSSSSFTITSMDPVPFSASSSMLISSFSISISIKGASLTGVIVISTLSIASYLTSGALSSYI